MKVYGLLKELWVLQGLGEGGGAGLEASSGRKDKPASFFWYPDFPFLRLRFPLLPLHQFSGRDTSDLAEALATVSIWDM